MHIAVKIGLALLVLGVRLWGKLFAFRELLKSDMSEYLTIMTPIFLGLLLGIIYLLFEKAVKPMIWRATMNRKGIALTPHWQPLLGNYKAIQLCQEDILKSEDPNQFPSALLAQKYFTDKEGRVKPIFAINTAYADHLVINDCNIAEQLLVKHAKSISKDQSITKINNDFTSQSWAYQKSNKEMKERRQNLMEMFSGDNFTILFNFVKQVGSKRLTELMFSNKPEDEETSFSLTSEILQAVGDIILLTMFGPEIVSEDKYLMVNQWRNGEKKPTPFAIAFQNTFSESHQKLWSYSRQWRIGNYMESNWSAQEKENLRNKEEIKQFISEKLMAFKELREKKAIDVERDFICYADVAIADIQLAKNNELMIAELLSLFANLALPTASSISSGLANIINNKEVFNIVKGELDQSFGEGLTADELSDQLGSKELVFTDKCFMEAMRLDPPQPMSDLFQTDEDIELRYGKQKITLSQGTLFQINTAAIHRDVTQWGTDSDKFNPFRLDPEQPAFLAPGGSKRHQFAWMPFLTGKHIYPMGAKVARMMQNVLGSMYITAMPTLMLDGEKKRIPQTNVLVCPMNDIMVKCELPLNIGRQSQPREEDEQEMKPTRESEGESPQAEVEVQ